MSASKRTVLAAVLCSLFPVGRGLGEARSASTEDFRVENQVFLGDREKPAVRSTTIFREGVVYDYLENPAEVIVFEKQGGRFALLDTARRVRAELTTQEVVAFTRQMQQRAESHKNPFIRFLAAPSFHEQFDQPSGELTLSSPWLTYRLVLMDAESPAIARQYREFSDWYARVNTLLNPGSRPPFARLLVNAALAKREAIAREVHLTLTPKEGFPRKRTTIHSRHQLVRRLVEADLDRVAQTRQFLEIFKPVEFKDYRRAPSP